MLQVSNETAFYSRHSHAFYRMLLGSFLKLCLRYKRPKIMRTCNPISYEYLHPTGSRIITISCAKKTTKNDSLAEGIKKEKQNESFVGGCKNFDTKTKTFLRCECRKKKIYGLE